MQTLTLLPQSHMLQAFPTSICTDSTLQWHCGCLLNRTKSSQDTVTSAECSDEGLLIGASNLNRTFPVCIGSRKGKYKDKTMI